MALLSLLLDTCTFLWLVDDESRVPARSMKLLKAAETVYLSAVSAYEISAKYAAGKLKLDRPADLYLEEALEFFGLACLPFTQQAASQVIRLPRLHTDPFDRMLLCQAIEHGLTIVTPDRSITQYPVKTIWS